MPTTRIPSTIDNQGILLKAPQITRILNRRNQRGCEARICVISEEKMDKVLILDFGSQYTQLIARRVRECRVYSEIVSFDITAECIKKENASAIILSGGPASVTGKRAPLPDKNIFGLGIPVLGICYGLQAMGALLGGKVEKSKRREYGLAQLEVINDGGLFAGTARRQDVWMSHGDRLVSLPRGFKRLGKSANSSHAAVADLKRGLYGLQFHPEVVHTKCGTKILKNFLHKIAGCRGNWTMANFLKREGQLIKQRVGEDKVILGISGGVDSTVLGVFLHSVLGKQLTGIFVNNGVLRQGEAKEVLATLRGRFKLNLRYNDATVRFLKVLKGITDPEKKRKAIGRTFIRVFEQEAKLVGGAKYLAQGTLYPDVIESHSPFDGPSDKIKSHHNVGGLPKDLKFKLIEPLRFLFKDEVRKLGVELGLPVDVIHRHPFPGPGLAVRMVGEVNPERLWILRQADAIIMEEIKQAGFYKKVWQSFAVLLPVKSVGVMGDERTYENVIVIRAVESQDAMTADWAQLPAKLLKLLSNRIINEVRGVNRVVYDISSKPPATIEWE